MNHVRPHKCKTIDPFLHLAVFIVYYSSIQLTHQHEVLGVGVYASQHTSTASIDFLLEKQQWMGDKTLFARLHG